MKRCFVVAFLCAAVSMSGCGRNSSAPNKEPAAAFSLSCSALTCTFTDQSTDVDGRIASRYWTFGDGATSADANPSHAYVADALTEFTAKLTVTDDDGGESFTSTTFKVSPPTHLQCGQDPDCTLVMQNAAKVQVELTSRECDAHGNTLVILQPVQMSVFTDGCYAPDTGTKFVISDNGNPFPAGTPISFQMLSGAGQQIIAPSLVLMGSTSASPWVLRFDDGEIVPADEDITVTVSEVP